MSDESKKLVIYFSYGGSTRAFAKKLAQEEGADIYEVEYQKKPTIIGAFFKGCPGAMKHKTAKTKPLKVDFAQYTEFIVAGPIWAGNPAPPVNSILQALPNGAKVRMCMLSGGGESNKEGAQKHAEGLGLNLVSYADVKAGE